VALRIAGAPHPALSRSERVLMKGRSERHEFLLCDDVVEDVAVNVGKAAFDAIVAIR